MIICVKKRQALSGNRLELHQNRTQTVVVVLAVSLSTCLKRVSRKGAKPYPSTGAPPEHLPGKGRLYKAHEYGTQKKTPRENASQILST